ncbi:MAG: (Na+)-NQR maturation NqrM [Pseudomonadota bacterium]
MATFLLAFILLLAVVSAMALGAMLMGKTLKGSCGGLNAVAGADKCLMCSRPIDPSSPLHERMDCPRVRAATAAQQGLADRRR